MKVYGTSRILVAVCVVGIFGCVHFETQKGECLGSLGRGIFWQVDQVESSWVVLVGPRGTIRHVPETCLHGVREGMVFRDGVRALSEERRLSLRVRELLVKLKSRPKAPVVGAGVFIRPRPP